MDEIYEQGHQLRALAMRVAALEDNVAFLEEWCEEQQDTLDKAVGPVGYDYEDEAAAALPPRTLLRVVDLRESDDAVEDDDADSIVAFVETGHDHSVHQIRTRLNRIRTRLAASLAPDDVSAKPAGRTAP